MPGQLHLTDGESRQWLEDYAFVCLFLSMPQAAVSLCKSHPLMPLTPTIISLS
jgi:hypothetical protein